MEKVIRFAYAPHSLFLETDGGSMLTVLPGGAIIKVGFLDSPSPVVRDFSQRLHVREGILYLELNDHRGRIQQIPLAEVEYSPELHMWLEAADRIIP